MKGFLIVYTCKYYQTAICVRTLLTPVDISEDEQSSACVGVISSSCLYVSFKHILNLASWRSIKRERETIA